MPFIRVPPDSTGKQVETFTPTSDHRQAVVVAGDTATAEVAEVSNIAPAATEYGLMVRNVQRREGQTLSISNLGSAGVFTQGAQDGNEDGSVFVYALAESNVDSAAQGFVIEEYDGDDDDFTDVSLIRIAAAATYNNPNAQYIQVRIRSRKWRVKYTNGGTGQTSFKLTVASSAVPQDYHLDFDSGAGTVELPVVGIGLPSAGGPVAGGTAADPFNIAAASLPLPAGAATLAGQLAAGHTVDVTDRAARDLGGVDILAALPIGANLIGKVTIRDAADAADIDPLAETTFTGRINTQGQKAMTASTPVVIASDQSPITVDAPVGTPTAVRISDGSSFYELAVGAAEAAAQPARLQVIAGEFDDAATFAPAEDQIASLRITAQRGAHVNLRDAAGAELPLPAALVGGRLDVDVGASVLPTGAATLAAQLADGHAVTVDNLVATPVPSRLSDGTSFYDATKTGQLPAALVGGRLDVVLGATGSAVSIEVEGDVAHDAPATGNPVLMAARANANEPAVVDTDADASYLWSDLVGRLVVTQNFPSNLVATTHGPVRLLKTGTGDTALVVAPGAGLSIHVTSIVAQNRDSAINVCLFKDATTIRWPIVGAADGGGARQEFNPPWKLAANAALNVALQVAGSTGMDIGCHFFVAA